MEETTPKDEDAKYTEYGPGPVTRPAERPLARPRPAGPARPTPRQLEFMDYELGMFIHFGLNTFTGQQHGDGKQPPSKFNPTDLDCEHWMRVAKSMGAKYVVFTARHEGGFCLWPTRTTDYSVAGSPWRNGRGDLVREFVDACRRAGLKVGLYHSSSFDARHLEARKLGSEEFLKMQLEQLTELLTGYGPIDYLWFDHHAGGEFWEAVDAAVARLQPQCLRFGPDVWIIGGHSGIAAETLWCAVQTADGKINSRPTRPAGEPWGRFFRVWEANTTGNGPWFWDDEVTSAAAPLAELVEKYYKSVGRGANFLLNFAPDRRGLVPEDAVASARQFGDEIHRRFGAPIAETEGEGEVVTLDLGKPTAIDHVVVMEDLADGQRIAAHRVEAMVGGGWRRIAAGRTVGHKRIYRFKAVAAEKVRFRCLKSIFGSVTVRRLAVHRVGEDPGP
ncbi:MAG: alpha-L-fucosidase [Planctomycetota bacterium]|jgi:alpha-L-fucosidase